MKKMSLSVLGAMSLLALGLAMPANIAHADDDTSIDPTGVVTDDGGTEPGVDEPNGGEPGVSDGDGSEGEPIVVNDGDGGVDEPVVDEGVEYDPVIAQSGAPESAGGGKVSLDFDHSNRLDDAQPGKFKLIWKGNKLYKIPVE